jgi:hypothetical protein
MEWAMPNLPAATKLWTGVLKHLKELCKPVLHSAYAVENLFPNSRCCLYLQLHQLFVALLP